MWVDITPQYSEEEFDELQRTIVSFRIKFEDDASSLKFEVDELLETAESLYHELYRLRIAFAEQKVR